MTSESIPEHEAVEGPSVWHGDELARSESWALRLDTRQLEATGRRIRDELEHGRGAVRIRGLDPASPGGIDDDPGHHERLFRDLARCIGTPVSQSTAGETIFRVADARLSADDRRARGPNSRNALTFHSDRCDVIGFLCVRQARAGGDNLLVSAGAIHNEIRRERPDLLDVLYQPFAWRRHTIDDANEHPYYRMPVFARTDGRFAVTLMQVLIERAHRAPELPDLTTPQREALELVQTLAADPAFHLRFRQQPGEMLFLNNYVTLHSRTAFEDPDDSAGRLLLRVWLSVPNSRQLPAAWAPHYGEVAAGALRGGIRVAD